jgi:cobalt-precorrin-7 (C5)-methyltransferase
MVKVIGVGAAPGLLTEQARREIENAGTVYGSKRAIDMVRNYIKGKKVVLADYNGIKNKKLSDDNVILSTGDPMVLGLGYLGDEIVSGISSVQLVCARLKIDMTDVCIIDGHSKDEYYVKDELNKVLSIKRVAMIVGRPKMDISKIFNDELCKDLDLILLEDVGYPIEKITYGDKENIPKITSSLAILVVRHRYE